MNKRKYYTDENDWVYCEADGKLYEYNYAEKNFVLTDKSVDLMNFHEFPESELEKNIKINAHFFK
mgnify:CR=1 FL=1